MWEYVCVHVYNKLFFKKEGLGSLFFKEAEINNTSAQLYHFTLRFFPPRLHHFLL